MSPLCLTGEYFIYLSCWINKEHTDVIPVKQHSDLSVHWFGTNQSTRYLSGNCKILLYNKSLNIQIFFIMTLRVLAALMFKMLTFNELFKDFFHDKIDDNSSFLRQIISYKNLIPSVSACITFYLLDKKYIKDDTGVCLGSLFGNIHSFFNTAPFAQSSFTGHQIIPQSSLRPEKEMLLLKYIMHTLIVTKLQLGLETYLC